MQDVYSKDMAVINEDGETEYIDTIDTTYTEVEQQEPDDFGEQQPNVPTEEADEPMSLDVLIDMEYNIISTGSKGNAVVINDVILIVAAFRLEQLKGVYKNIKIVLLTHIHSDHF